jgi:hypothetical protein
MLDVVVGRLPREAGHVTVHTLRTKLTLPVFRVKRPNRALRSTNAVPIAA